MDELGAAFVEGEFDLQGDITQAIRICDELGTALLQEEDAQPTRTAHDKDTDAQAIAYHYDVSNAFYQLWLDPDMAYSCAYFKTPDTTLETAQQDKFDHLCRKLRLQAGDYLLDVGCGWGGLARFAAREYGARVMGITLSEQQLALAQQRVRDEGLDDRVELKKMDYRDLPQDGRFDKVVSVGMFEHVGHANLPLYCRILFGAVREGGLVMNHGITAKHVDGRPVGHGAGAFIGQYVFPHGELPHLSMMCANVCQAGLEVADVESLRLHYAKTLGHWSERLEHQLHRAAAEIPEKTLRIWRLYLAGCAYAFAKGWIDLHQILAVKPYADGHHDLPWTREDLYR
jgi:cyclopropane-fatty-acyl-phospholipid synthase